MTAEELDAEEAIAQIDELLGTNPKKLRETLQDRGVFVSICDKGWEAAGKAIRHAEDLATALTEVALQTKTPAVTLEEAEEMFIPDLTLPEFYHLSREYFTSLCSSLDYDDDWQGMLTEELKKQQLEDEEAGEQQEA
eukprot:TRINITY_DN31902_c0_g1_i1.p1 TRINITY_DN31902_c0_g1~~TRINITY_DN31902_c0_g1_i1.p1  ORF type:complete len:154 (+),score=60.44 TRINITY_DN31902_c0_g1_i1:53-463(+)